MAVLPISSKSHLQILAQNLFPTLSFPNKLAPLSLQGMLVTASRHGGSEYSYNTVTVVFMTELLKLLLSSGVYLKDNSPASLLEAVVR